MKRVVLIGFLLSGFAFVFTACNDSHNTKKSTTNVDRKGSSQLAADETYTCTMHNEVMSDHPSECPKCGMKLVKQKMTAEQERMMKEGSYVKPKE